MILATYQAITPKKTFRSRSPALDDFLGYHPIWCFSSNNFKDFMINSILAAPWAPEVLYIFETDKYTAINIVKWNMYSYYKKTSTPYDLSECFEPCEEKYCEYIVNEIPPDNIILKINIHDAIHHTKYHCDENIGSILANQMESTMNCAADRAHEWAENTYNNSTITSKSDEDLNHTKKW